MRVSLGLCLMFLAVPVTVLACEGDCIVAITNAWVGNYSDPVAVAMYDAASKIADIMPHKPTPSQAFSYLNPIVQAYNKAAYDNMRTAIFPNKFHGKCQQNGVDPPGCPNPDCPVVCGTPGSLVHFFSDLRYIGYNATKSLLQNYTRPGSETYHEVEQRVMQDVNSNKRRSSRIFPRAATPTKPKSSKAKHTSTSTKNAVASHVHISSASPTSPVRGNAQLNPPNPANPPASASKSTDNSAAAANKMIVPLFLKRSEDVKTQLGDILAKIPDILLHLCGGSPNDGANGLPKCSWEALMKQYILSFP